MTLDHSCQRYLPGHYRDTGRYVCWCDSCDWLHHGSRTSSAAAVRRHLLKHPTHVATTERAQVKVSYVATYNASEHRWERPDR